MCNMALRPSLSTPHPTESLPYQKKELENENSDTGISYPFPGIVEGERIATVFSTDGV